MGGVSTELILASALLNKDVASSLRGILTSRLCLPSPFQLAVGQFLVEFVDKHDRTPKVGDWALWIGTLDGTYQMGVRQVFTSTGLQHPEAFTTEYLVAEAEKHFRKVGTVTSLADLNRMGDNITPEAFLEAAQAVSGLTVVDFSPARVKDVDKWLQPDHSYEERIPTGFNFLDRQLGGGWEKELVFVMADSGRGKSILLTNFAVAAAGFKERGTTPATGQPVSQKGFHVLHISLENFLRPSINRYYRRVAGMNEGEFRSSQDSVSQRLHTWVKWTPGEIHVIYTDAYSITCEDVRVMADRYVQKTGRIDMLILDYLDILAPPSEVRNKSEPSQHAHAAHRIRGISESFQCTVHSATQAVRGAGDRPRLRLSDMGESYGKVRAAGVVLGIVQNEEEQQNSQGRIAVLKVREHAGRGLEYPVLMDLDRMTIVDLDRAHPGRVAALRGSE